MNLRDLWWPVASIGPSALGGRSQYDHANRLFVVDPRRDARYRALAESGSVFSSPPWIEAIAEAYNFEPRASLVSDHNGTPLAALPYVQLNDLCGQRVVVFPFSDYCTPPGASDRTWPLLLQPLLATEWPITLRVFDGGSLPSASLFQRTGRAIWHGTDATAADDVRWARLKGSARGNIRKAWAHGVTVERRTDWAALAIFHGMHRQVRRRKYRMLAQPESYFRALAEAFADSGNLTVLLAYHNGEPVAGGLMLAWHDTLYYKLNASIRSAMRPNDLLVWEGIKLAHEQGLEWFDFGLSNAEQDNLIRFKRKFATAEREIVTLRHEPAYPQPAVAQPARQSVGAIATLLTDDRVPDAILDAASEQLYRYFA